MIHFRAYQKLDYEACIKIYDENLEQGYIPFHQDYRSEFIKDIENPDILTIVGEKDNKVVATGSINYLGERSVALLSWGLVLPNYQKQKIGSLLLTYRISLLSIPNFQPLYVFLNATVKSLEFYSKVFNFQQHDIIKDENNMTFFILHIWLTEPMLHEVQLYLEKSLQHLERLEVPIMM